MLRIRRAARGEGRLVLTPTVGHLTPKPAQAGWLETLAMRLLTLPVPGTPVVLANGLFPSTEVALRYLTLGRSIICCDGAVDSLVAWGGTPSVVIGDLDSISAGLRARFADRLIRIDDQETNDLTKAILWARDLGHRELVILGADGKRLDHALGNASLVAEHFDQLSLSMITDQGLLVSVAGQVRFHCHPGQQVSIFALTAGMHFTSAGLRYPLLFRTLDRWWQGTLNEAQGNEFSLNCSSGQALVFLAHPGQTAAA